MSIEVMKQALEALENSPTRQDVYDAKIALRQAIEQAEKVEPVGSVVEDDNDFGRVKAILDQDARVQLAVGTKLYTHPPTAPAQHPLSEEQILHFVDIYVGGPTPSYPLDNSDWINFARAIEAIIKGATE